VPEKQWSLASCRSWWSVPIGPPAPIAFEIHALVVELEPVEAVAYPLRVDNETLSLAPSVRKYVERAFAGVTRDKFFADTLTPAQQQAWTQIQEHVRAIAERRNDVVHKGFLTGGAAELKANIAHAKTLLSFD
jgi:hypothetical protein